MSERELKTIGQLIKTLPVFQDFEEHRLAAVAKDCTALLQEPDGIHAVGAIAALLRQPEVAPTAAPARGTAEAAPSVPELSPAERRLIKERRIKLGVAGGMLTVFAALIVILVASLSKQLFTSVAAEPPNRLPTPATSTASAAPTKTSASSGTQPAAPPVTTDVPTSPSTSVAPASAVVPITAAGVYDPEGAQSKDYIGRTQRVFDGDPTTAWLTFVYNQQFPTTKTGVGLVLTLDKAVTATSVQITNASPGTVIEVRSIPKPESSDLVRDVPLSETKVLGTGTAKDSSPFTIAVTGAQPSQYLCVFITQMAPTPDGKFQSQIGEIQVSGF